MGSRNMANLLRHRLHTLNLAVAPLGGHTEARGHEHPVQGPIGVGRLGTACALQRLSIQIETLSTVANATQAVSGTRE
jgi:hypothetical protein